MTQITLIGNTLQVEHLSCDDPQVLQLFRETSESSWADLASRALVLGVIGLRAAGVAGHVEIIEREFQKLSCQFDEVMGAVEADLMSRVAQTFDPDQAQSVSARLSTSIDGAHAAAGDVVTQARNDLAKLIGDSFNPDLATSCIYRVGKLVADTGTQLDRAFDPAFEGSHLAKLVKLVDSYFGKDGSIAEVVAGQVAPVKTELLEALQGLRELVVGHAMAAEERQHSTASGTDFEDEVEAVLCKVASAYGDTVDRVGTRAGDAGLSKLGDFVVQLPSGARFVVEAKKRSTALPLRGEKGVLAILRDSMVNRSASFAIAVAKDRRAFAKEVGCFNDYEADKVLCQFGEGGELLEVAYRWARTALLVDGGSAEGIDLTVVSGAIDEARRAIRELTRIEAKAKSIAQGADDIQSLITFQVRRLNTALDEAVQALTVPATLAAS